MTNKVLKKKPNKPGKVSLKQLNKKMRQLKAQKEKAVNPDTKAQLEREIIQLISDKNKVKKGGVQLKKKALKT